MLHTSFIASLLQFSSPKNRWFLIKIQLNQYQYDRSQKFLKNVTDFKKIDFNILRFGC